MSPNAEALQNAEDVFGIANLIADAMHRDPVRTAVGLLRAAEMLVETNQAGRTMLAKRLLQSAHWADPDIFRCAYWN